MSLKFYVRPMTYIQLCRDQKTYISKLQKQIHSEKSEDFLSSNQEKIITEILYNSNNIKKKEMRSNEVESIRHVTEEKANVEEEHKIHLIDQNDQNNDFKPTSQIKMNSSKSHNNVINNFLDHNTIFNQSTQNNKTNNNLVFNPALENYIYSDDGIYKINLDNSFLSIMDSIQLIDSQTKRRDQNIQINNNIIMNTNNIKNNSNENDPFSQKLRLLQQRTEKIENYNDFIKSSNNENKVNKIKKQYNCIYHII